MHCHFHNEQMIGPTNYRAKRSYCWRSRYVICAHKCAKNLYPVASLCGVYDGPPRVTPYRGGWHPSEKMWLNLQKQWTNEVGQVKKVGMTPFQAVDTRVKSKKSGSDEQERSSVTFSRTYGTKYRKWAISRCWNVLKNGWVQTQRQMTSNIYQLFLVNRYSRRSDQYCWETNRQTDKQTNVTSDTINSNALHEIHKQCLLRTTNTTVNFIILESIQTIH